MRSSSEERKEMICSPSQGPKYPYGLKITLNAETLDKLGIKDAPKVDSMIKFMAEAKVVSVSSEEEGYGEESDYNICLQIVEMELDKGKTESNTVDVLYRK